MLKMFNMAEAQSAITPLASLFRSFSGRCPCLPREDEMSPVPYASVVRPPRNTMVCSRFDVACAVLDKSIMSNTEKQQLDAEKWIFEYLQGTANLDLVFQSG